LRFKALSLSSPSSLFEWFESVIAGYGVRGVTAEDRKNRRPHQGEVKGEKKREGA